MFDEKEYNEIMEWFQKKIQWLQKDNLIKKELLKNNDKGETL